MTREEKIAILKDIIDGEIIHPQVRKDVGTWAIEALSSSEKPNKWIDAEVLDKIRAEIETDLSHFCFDEWGNENPTWKEIKAIIDKYKAESEDKE